MLVFIQLSKFKKVQIRMERRAEDIIRGRAHTLTHKEYAEREKRINAIINDMDNCS
jgi:hypothetical protein